MVKLSTLLAKRLHIAVQWADLTVNVSFRLISDEIRHNLPKEPTLFDELKALVTEWDVTDDAGEMAPIDETTFAQLPLGLLQAINREMVAAQYGRKE